MTPTFYPTGALGVLANHQHPRGSRSPHLGTARFFSLLTSAHVQSWVPQNMPGLPSVAPYPDFPGSGTPANLPTPATTPSLAYVAPPEPAASVISIHIAVANPSNDLIIQIYMEWNIFRIRTLFSVTFLHPKTMTGQ